jgi:hypothetical protein
VRTLTEQQARRMRALANGLGRPVRRSGPTGVTDVVRRVGGLQAQTWPAAALAVRARSTATTWADVDTARLVDRSVVRGWFQRGTLHLVATEDAGWLLRALGPVTEDRTARRYAELGLSETVRRDAATVIEAETTGRGPLTRAEIGDALVAKGLLPEPTGQAVYALIRYAGLRGLLCYGPDRGSQETWVATRDWLGEPLDLSGDRAVALAELCGRYLGAYGPAAPADLATWAGLPAGDAKAAFGARRDLVEVEVGGQRAAVLRGRRTTGAPAPLRLLGEFDTYLLGHDGPWPVHDERFRRRVHPGGGVLRPVVVADGIVVGGWRFDRRRGVAAVDPFEPDLVGTAELDAEVADIARFTGLGA